MAFGGLDPREPAAPMAEINMTPLIDVMLVLLVIFIITAPLLTHAIRLDLPKAAAAPARELPDTITLSIDADGRLFWDAAPVSEAALADRFRAAVARGGAPELHLRAAASARYDTIARVMSAAQAAGLTRIGFVTEPDAGTAAASPKPGADVVPPAPRGSTAPAPLAPLAPIAPGKGAGGVPPASAWRRAARAPRPASPSLNPSLNPYPVESFIDLTRRVLPCPARAVPPPSAPPRPRAARDGLTRLSGRYNRPFPRDPGSATFDPLQPARAAPVPTA